MRNLHCLDPRKYDVTVWNDEDVEAVRQRCSKLRHSLRTKLLTAELDGLEARDLLTLADGIEQRAIMQLRMKRIGNAMEYSYKRRMGIAPKKRKVSVEEFAADFGGGK